MSEADAGDAVEISPAAYRRDIGRTWVMANMVMSVDGSCVVGGQARALSGSADRHRFRSLRSLADTVLVGAATARAERYTVPAPRTPPAHTPRLAVVSSSLDLPADLPFLTQGASLPSAQRPLILTTEEGSQRGRASYGDACELVPVADTAGRLEPAALLTELRDRRMEVVLCEGGPHLLGQLAVAGLVDEWFITISPMVVTGEGSRITAAPPDTLAALTLMSAREADGFVLLHYLSSR